jgi:predicted nucleic acid-binding protein
LTSELEDSEDAALVLDTSAVINILGCGRSELLLRSLRRPCVVEERVLAELTHHPIPLKDAQAEIAHLNHEGLITVDRMSDEDYEVFLEIAAASGRPCLGIGESAAIALAANPKTRHALVLDDQKARKQAAAKFPAIEVISSVRVFLEAGRTGGLDQGETRDLFVAAIDNASMCVLKEEHDLVLHLGLGKV